MKLKDNSKIKGNIQKLGILISLRINKDKLNKVKELYPNMKKQPLSKKEK